MTGKKEIIDALNSDLASELGAITQYMWHHVMGKGFGSLEILEEFRDVSITEMKHAEKLAERIDYLGGIPTKQPTSIKMGGDLRHMVEDNLEGENTAIKQYKQHIKLAIEASDPVTRLMLEEILSDEEEHAYKWETVLEKRP